MFCFNSVGAIILLLVVFTVFEFGGCDCVLDWQVSFVMCFVGCVW